MTRPAREQQLDALSTHLGGRRLVWFGIRGDDAASLLALPQFRHCVALTAPLRAGRLALSSTMEELTGERVDLDQYDIDHDADERRVVAARALRHQLLASLRSEAVLATYRPSHFLSAIHFASLDTTESLGLFKDRQSAFEHKPWVEVELARVGVPVLPWKYVSDEARTDVLRDLEVGPLILRPSRSSGGEGIALLRSSDDLDHRWPERSDHLVSVAPFLEDALPVNVGACVWSDGQINLFPGSVQLIGINGCTRRQFGYCGNDFSAFGELPVDVVERIDLVTRLVGGWLATRGFVGAFGVDLLVDQSGVHFVELNPRFQGSTAMTAALAADAGLPDPVLDNLLAHADVRAPATPSLWEWARSIPPAAQVIVHNLAAAAVQIMTGADRSGRRSSAELVPDPGVGVEPGGVLARLSFGERVTADGFSITVHSSEEVAAVVGSYYSPPSEGGGGI
jgi:hypothetical protein